MRRGEDGFLYAQVTTRPGEVPSRFSGRLPESVAEFDGDWAAFPPRGQVAGALCAGDPEMTRRWVSAVESAAERGPIERELEARFVRLAVYCDGPRYCDLALQEAERASEPVAKVLLRSLIHCRSPKAVAAIESGSSDEAVVDLYFQRFDERLPRLTDRFKSAARGTVQARTGRDLRKLGVTLGRFDDPAVVEFVGSLGTGLDAESRAWLGIGMRGSALPGAAEVHERACRHPVVGKDPMCDSEVTDLRSLFPAASPQGLDGAVRDYEFDPHRWLAAHSGRRAELVAALQRCIVAQDEREWQRVDCAKSLASIDRARAASVLAQAQNGSSLTPQLRALQATLAQFSTNAAVDAAALEWGLVEEALSEQPEPDGGPGSVLLVDRLLDAGRLHVLDVETGMFPNEHDALMVELAGYAGEDLAGVVFEEVPPKIRQTDQAWETVGPYLLRAYADGQILETKAADYGDWYDLDAVLGLLNATLRELESDVRYVVVDTDGQIASVLGAPKSGIARARERGLMVFVNADEAMRLGKEFEQKYIERLEAGDTP
ncbi:MAG: hypothetical protein AAGF92_02180 [Myxococcota bacterium]